MIKSENDVVTTIGNNEEISNDIIKIVRALIKSKQFEDYEIITAVATGFFAEDKEKQFLKIATLLNGFDFESLRSKLEEGEANG